ncbi:MAG: glycoside hydrolase family 2 protein, partial [Flavobacteriales bacterium]
MKNKLRLLFLMMSVMIVHQTCAQFVDLDLNWRYHRNSEKRNYPATVPGTVYKDHVDQGLVDDPFLGINEREMTWLANSDWTYATQPFSFASRELQRLRFNGLDTYAEVYLNDSLILSCDNAFRIWESSVRFLSEGNVLRVNFHSPVERGKELLMAYPWPIPGDSLRAITRKPQCHFGWDWGPQYLSCGITGKVQVRPEQEIFISTCISTTTSANEQEASLWFRVEAISPWDSTLTFELTNNFNLPGFTQEIKLKRGENVIAFPLHVNTPPLWYCNGQGFANLIDFTASLKNGSTTLAQRTVRSGIRSANWVIEPDYMGESFYLELNGQPVFIKGVNVIPVALYPLPELEKRDVYTRFIQKLKSANINMVRVWGGGVYEDDLFYDLCDEYGIMVWQDFMFACSMYPGSEAFLDNVSHEADDQLRRLSHHPSIVLWCGNNENAEGWSRWGW